MEVKRRDIEANLPHKGFIKEEKTRHTYFHHCHNGLRTGISTFISRGSQFDTYDKILLGKMKQQLFLNSTQQVYDLLTCPMDGDRYKKILNENGKLSL